MRGMQPQDVVRRFAPEPRGLSSKSLLASSTVLKVLLLDFAAEPSHLVQFEQILAASQEARFEVESHHIAGGIDRDWLQRKVETTRLVGLFFDRPPGCALLDSVLGVDGEAVNGRPLIVLAPSSSTRNVRDILAHGVAELFSPHHLGCPHEVLGRVLYLVDDLAPEQDQSLLQFKRRSGLEHLMGESQPLRNVLNQMRDTASCEAN